MTVVRFLDPNILLVVEFGLAESERAVLEPKERELSSRTNRSLRLRLTSWLDRFVNEEAD
jgi:hypothetical protein